MEIVIIGAGMSGLLAARILKMRGHKVLVLEKQQELPNNHNAVLRFRSNVVSDITGIPFTKVQMIKGTVPYLNPVAEALAYSFKVTGTYSTDRSITGGLTVADRWIAPSDFIKQLAEGITIQFDTPFTIPFDQSAPVISTIPMPNLIRDLDYYFSGDRNNNIFKSRPGFILRAYLRNCYAFASVYTPDPDIPFYRASITGDELIVEFPYDHGLDKIAMRLEATRATHLLGIGSDKGKRVFYEAHLGDDIVSIIPQPYAKIEPINERLRKSFMGWATDKYNIYSLGRYATWRPGLLLDDLVKDIKLIEGWIVNNNNYDVRRSR